LIIFCDEQTNAKVAFGLVSTAIARRENATHATVARASRIYDLFNGKDTVLMKVGAARSLTPSLRELEAICDFCKLAPGLRKSLQDGAGTMPTTTAAAFDAADAAAASSACVSARIGLLCGHGFAAHAAKAANASQLRAVLAGIGGFDLSPSDDKASVHTVSQALSLVQGPPGTGKTTTLCLILNALHLREFQAYYTRVGDAAWAACRTSARGGDDDPSAWLKELADSRPHILVCAPSNVAVDNVVERLFAKGFVDGQLRPYRPDVVRIGMRSKKGDAGPDKGFKTLEGLVEDYFARDVSWLETQKKGADVEIRQQLRDFAAARKRLRLFAKAPRQLPDGWEARVQPLKQTSLSNDMPVLYFVDHVLRRTQPTPPPIIGTLFALKTVSPEFGLVMQMLHAALEGWIRAMQQAQVCATVLESKRKGRDEYLSRRALEARLLGHAEVVACTLHGAGHASLDDHAGFSAVVVDEAANAREPTTLVALRRARRSETPSIVLVGDARQLAATRFFRGDAWAGASLFERLEESRAASVELLDTQYRMHPKIARFCSQTFYGARLLDAPCVFPKAEAAWRCDAFSPLTFLALQTSAEDSRGSGAGSRSNRAEAQLCAHAYKTLLKRSAGLAKPLQVAIVTFYREQLRELERELRLLNLDTPLPEINTVDAFQGRETDVLFLSCVRANADGVGFLKDARRMNVALTRARQCCVVVGREDTLATDAHWRALLDYSKQAAALVVVPTAHADLARLRRQGGPLPEFVPPPPAAALPKPLAGWSTHAGKATRQTATAAREEPEAGEVAEDGPEAPVRRPAAPTTGFSD